jgi:hypothetical protein
VRVIYVSCLNLKEREEIKGGWSYKRNGKEYEKKKERRR